MKIKIFTVPFSREHETFFDDHVNEFLLNKKVKNIKAEFFESGGSFYWSILIVYDVVVHEIDRKGKTKEKVKLDEKDTLLLQRLKEWRKEQAEKEGLPAFIVATNTELLSVVKVKPGSKEGIKMVKGFGKKKIEKYGDDILKITAAFK